LANFKTFDCEGGGKGARKRPQPLVGRRELFLLERTVCARERTASVRKKKGEKKKNELRVVRKRVPVKGGENRKRKTLRKSRG